MPARAVGGAVRELQRYVSCGEPVLETKHMRCKCANEEWTSCIGCTKAKQGNTGKKRCESTCDWNGTWLGMLYMHFSNIRLSLEGDKGVPTLREGIGPLWTKWKQMRWRCRGRVVMLLRCGGPTR